MMNPYSIFPDQTIHRSGPVSETFLSLGISLFQGACRFVHELPYGYNSNRDDMMLLFKEEKGSCTTKHAVIATLARELGLPIEKHIGIYAMVESIVTGTQLILARCKLPYVPMVHCFLVYTDDSKVCPVDLTKGNLNGKNSPIEQFLFNQAVKPDINEKDEYLLYRRVLTTHILRRDEFAGVEVKTVLQAREQAIALLRSKV